MSQVSFSLLKSKHLSLLKPLFGIVNKTTVLQQLENVKIVHDNGHLEFTTSNLVNFLTVKEPYGSPKKFSFTVEASKIRDILENALENEVCFTGGERRICGKTGGFSIYMNCLSADEFPKPPEFTPDKEFKLDTEEVRKAFETALLFKSKDDLRPSMCGILLCDYEGQITAVTTDAHRLYWKALFKTPDHLKGLRVIMEASTVTSMLSFFANEIITLSLSNEFVKMTSGNKSLQARFIDARYPDFERVMNPRDNNAKLYASRKQLINFITLAEKFVDSTEKRLNVEVNETSIKIQGRTHPAKFYSNPDDDEGFECVLPVYKYDGHSGFRFSINIEFLKQAININKKDEYVIISMGESSTSALMIDDCCLLMPLHTAE